MLYTVVTLFFVSLKEGLTELVFFLEIFESRTLS